MCSRYALLEQHYRQVLERLGIPAPARFLARFNIPPGGRIPAVRRQPGGGAREAVALHWGLVPSWAASADGAARLANARAESLADKPSFRDAWRSRRCVVPASGFYEWSRRGRQRLPWFFERADGRPFCFAGLWESWRPPGGEPLESCTLVTTGANELMHPVHDRMPVVLTPAQCERWLAVDEPPPADLLRAAAPAAWRRRRVSQRVNRVAHDDPACLEPPAPDEAAGEPLELDLGP